MDWKKILNNVIEVTLFCGTLITILCLVVFLFIASTAWLSVLAGLGAMNALFIYDRYRQNNKNP